ncbi:hypothetical protein [Rugamonas sp. DEMB1]|uniref:hypothetical protein n=1 Tax=Rugamonas sp. DEMB1 TaxID=3039386 RepID=UPI00244C1D90|nr:hypothetical protein [Rugamonas sp. DEMB1]WGG52114.1 hypothetical protein QC826_08035 [Rugamonas sp. DEMB1]
MQTLVDAPVLSVPDSPITIAACELADAKANLDALSRTAGGRRLARQIVQSKEGGNAISPFGFAGSLLPFFSTQRSKCERGPRYKGWCRQVWCSGRVGDGIPTIWMTRPNKKSYE